MLRLVVRSIGCSESELQLIDLFDLCVLPCSDDDDSNRTMMGETHLRESVRSSNGPHLHVLACNLVYVHVLAR